jgi:hypothetical protein
MILGLVKVHTLITDLLRPTLMFYYLNSLHCNAISPLIYCNHETANAGTNPVNTASERILEHSVYWTQHRQWARPQHIYSAATLLTYPLSDGSKVQIPHLWWSWLAWCTLDWTGNSHKNGSPGGRNSFYYHYSEQSFKKLACGWENCS